LYSSSNLVFAAAIRLDRISGVSRFPEIRRSAACAPYLSTAPVADVILPASFWEITEVGSKILKNCITNASSAIPVSRFLRLDKVPNAV
jgi:hypothetical protein